MPSSKGETMDFKDSRTAQNLLKAFAGRSQARNRTHSPPPWRGGLEHVAAIFIGDGGQRGGRERGVVGALSRVRQGRTGRRRSPDAAKAFEWVAKVEKEHEARFKRLLDHVVNGTVFQRGEKIYWRCRECGYIHEGTVAPKACPVCQHPQAHFEPVGENF